LTTGLAFELPSRLEARRPTEARGLARDEVRLLVADGDELHHARFRDLPSFLAPGDVLVVNTSATLPAALPARLPDGSPVGLHLSTPVPDDETDVSPLIGGKVRSRPVRVRWVVELRRDGAPSRAADAGLTLSMPAGARAALKAPYSIGQRLWTAELTLPEPLLAYLSRHGRPIRYGYVREDWPLADYQTVFAAHPGSAEMPSAGRPFSHRLLATLAAHGVEIAPLLLHTGVSSPEEHEPPYPEWFRVPPSTAAAVNAARGRVIAVGTTVVRALESVASPDGTVEAGQGWTDLVITPARGVYAVDGIVTGWHEPAASHLQMLAGIAGEDLIERSYAAALEHGYLWHEFGDSHLILP
jgi:S-adenosylmethionine:tRNA ribosyltransferase-isomerase